MSELDPQQFWSDEHQRWLSRHWSDEYQRWYLSHYVEDQWVFFEWCPQKTRQDSFSGADSAARDNHAYGVGRAIFGTYNPDTPQTDVHYERLDPSFYVRPKDFFNVGRVFAVLFTEPAGSTATNYNDSVTLVKYGEAAYTQVRRFVVVRQRKQFCFAVPIFTYQDQGTLKPGVPVSEHAIAYSWGQQPELLPGESGIVMDPICIVMNEGERPLSVASRIYFGIHHPIQYNVKVKDIGYVSGDHMGRLLGNWSMVSSGLSAPDTESFEHNNAIIENTELSIEESSSSLTYESVTNPRGFFKKGRVFMTAWAAESGDPSYFVVVKPKSKHCICLRISSPSMASFESYSAASHYGSVITTDTADTEPNDDVQSPEETIYVKVEDESNGLEPGSKIDFGKPYTLDYDIQIRNIGRVFGDSIGRMERNFAANLGFTK